jgi:hypothetical protein
LSNGRTVATALIHLAFWDEYYLAMLEAWEQSESVESSGGSSLVSRGINVDAVNSAIEGISLSVPARMAGDLARSAADRTDQKFEGISPALAVQNEQHGHTRALRRSIHRREHLNRIEQALAD